jgi:two-component system CheB/CheR fusion protein
MTPMDLDREVERIYLTHFVPAGVVVNEAMDILQFRGETGPFLQPRPGKATLNLLAFVKPELTQPVQQCFRTAQHTHQPARMEAMLWHRSSERPCSISVFPIVHTGQQHHFLIIFSELADHVAATASVQATAHQNPLPPAPVDAHETMTATEQALPAGTATRHVQPEWMEAAWQDSPVAMVVADEHLQIVAANTAFCTLLSADPQQLLEQPLYAVLHDDTSISRQLLENLLMQDETGEFEMSVHTATSKEKLLKVSGKPLSIEGKETKLLLVTAEEVTGQKKAQQVLADREAWLRNMTDNIPVMICLTGADNTGTFFNSAWIAYTGRTREQEENGGWITGIHPEDVARFTEMLNTHFSGRQPFQIELRLRRHDGRYRWVCNNWQPVFAQEGAFTGYIICCTEVHAKKIMQEELEKEIEERTADLQRMNKELEQYNTELQQFTYVSSHDLQEPLRKIITYADRLQERFKDKLPDNGKDYIGKIISSARFMSRLINDLLEYTRISRSEETFSRTDLHAVFNKVQKNFERQIRDKQAVVNCDKLPIVDAVPQQMEQLFSHLLSNALKFTYKDRAPVINIMVKKLSGEKLERYQKGNRQSLYYEIIVQDTGIGFNQQYADQVFTIFQRLHGKQDFTGTGIGLALCKKIAYHHKGDIYAESQENEGTAFHVILPARQG